MLSYDIMMKYALWKVIEMPSISGYILWMRKLRLREAEQPPKVT